MEDEFKKYGLILMSKYIKTGLKVDCLNKDGYMVTVSLNKLRMGRTPRPFDKNNPHTIKNIEKWVSENTNYKLLSKEYNGSSEYLEFECPEHGIFKMWWSNIQYGKRCGSCYAEVRDLDDFIRVSNIVHKNKYDYSKSVYKTSKSLTKIICPTHGEFEQIPDVHLSGSECPRCGHLKVLKAKSLMKKKKDSDKLGYVYVIKCWNKDESFYKIGVSVNCSKRFYGKGNMPYNFKILKTIKFEYHKAIMVEMNLHKKYSKNRYIPKIKFGGYLNECYSNLKLEGDKNEK